MKNKKGFELSVRLVVILILALFFMVLFPSIVTGKITFLFSALQNPFS
jgi:competence protein ComGC